MEGLHPSQPENSLYGFTVKFKSDLGGKDWIYGSFYDEDSIKRVAGYREGGKWISLPINFYYGSYARDIEYHGDTLLIGGSFSDIRLDSDSSFFVQGSYLLKWFNDSLWAEPLSIVGAYDIATYGDTLLIWGASFNNPPSPIVFTQFMTEDGGQTWNYPYNIIHPTETTANFGAYPRIEIVNGEIITSNNGSPPGSNYKGVSRWDGNQWHAYGKGLSGAWSRCFDFDFYKGELIMGGTFSKFDSPDNPGDFIARWDGNKWNEMATGLDNHVIDLFAHDSLLYCHSNGVIFGDAYIPHFAAWDGSQWCGTSLGYFSQEPTSYGFANDTLFASFYHETSLNGDTLPPMIYFDGNYAKGASAICSSPGLSTESIGNEDAEWMIVAYPNPTQGQLFIKLENHEINSYKLFDLHGNLLLEEKHLKSNEVEINIQSLSNGMYILSVNEDLRIKVFKEN
jgi:hypothetical protein